MAINQNHLFEELDGVKCAIVEKNVSLHRTVFLQSLLAFNGYTVVTIPSPPPKASPVAAPPAPAAATAETTANPPSTSAIPQTPPTAALPPAPPETFTVGVTDTTFNSINAVFGRLLKTPDGHVVTLAYWKEAEKVSHDDIPYFEFIQNPHQPGSANSQAL